MSSLFLRGEHPSTDRADRGRNSKVVPSNAYDHLSSLVTSSLPEDSAHFDRNAAEVTAAAATAAAAVTVSNSQSPNATPQATPEIPPRSISKIGPIPKSGHLQTPGTGYGPRDRDHGNADFAEDGIIGPHDAPNWSRMKSSIILLGATILYAVIAGLSPFVCVKW